MTKRPDAHTIALYCSFHRGYAERRAVSSSAGLSYSPPFCLSACKKLGQYLPHPCLCSAGQLVVSIVRQSFHIPVFNGKAPSSRSHCWPYPGQCLLLFPFLYQARANPIPNPTIPTTERVARRRAPHCSNKAIRRASASIHHCWQND